MELSIDVLACCFLGDGLTLHLPISFVQEISTNLFNVLYYNKVLAINLSEI
jgi:hypothetical protein